MHCLSYVFSSLFDTNQSLFNFSPHISKSTTTLEEFWIEISLIVTTKVCNALIVGIVVKESADTGEHVRVPKWPMLDTLS